MMLGKLAVSPSSALVLAACLDLVVDPLRETICAKLKDNAVKQQVERHEDLVSCHPYIQPLLEASYCYFPPPYPNVSLSQYPILHPRSHQLQP